MCHFTSVLGQSYHALNGSDHAGAFNNYTNPAGMTSTVYPWDVSVIGFQSITANNGIRFNNFTFKNPSKTLVQPTSGTKQRYVENNADFNLFNAQFQLDKDRSIGFGTRLRTYNSFKASPFQYVDTISGFFSFLNYNGQQNTDNEAFRFSIVSNAWSETDLSYAQVVEENTDHRLSFGVTLALLRSISGFYFGIQDLTYKGNLADGIPSSNTMLTGSTAFLYPESFNKMDSSLPFFKNYALLKKNGRLSLGLSFGAEWTVKERDPGDPDNIDGNYAWKIGLSVMDIGRLRYRSNRNSFLFSDPKTNVTDTGLDRQFKEMKGNSYKQTLSKNFTVSDPFQSDYAIQLPTRFVLDIDKPLGLGFYANAQLNLSVHTNDVSNIYDLKTIDLNLLTLTGRYENEKFGAYVPILYNAREKINAGLAVRYGALLIGMHNIDWFQRTRLEELNGGYYMSLLIRPHARQRHDPLGGYRY